MAPASDESDGIVHRLAKRLFASPDSPFTEFADRQRIERLDQCRQLERILKACQSAHNDDARIADNNGLDANPTEETNFGPTDSGKRISRFFGWKQGSNNDEQSSAQQTGSSVISEAASSFTDGVDNQPASSSKAVNSKRTFSKDCHVETHELWACRALALGCGGHLGDLRRCWADANLAQATKNEMTYENGSDEACRDIQLNMSKCVNKNAAELAERVQARKKQ